MLDNIILFLKKLSIPLKIAGILLMLLLGVFIFSLQKPLFNSPKCTVINDSAGNLLGAKIADDGQWRFPYNLNVPTKFVAAITQFEDRYFFYHPGINLFSIIRAIKQNIIAKKVVSGGSTITAQVIRLSRKGKPRNLWQKTIEYFLALRLELKYSKKDILALYASNAPFGGNVVGLDAAAWRYYGRPPNKLSWGETATLAVLPNAPSLIFPGRNHDLLVKKRNRLLNKLYKKCIIDSLTCELAKAEPLPNRPKPLPRLAPHLLIRLSNEGFEGQNITTTINSRLQKHTNRIINKHYNVLLQNKIYNAAALVLDVETGNTLAYVGNTTGNKLAENGQQVDIITSARSTGSTLKPFLYALMQKEGVILPMTLIADIPTHIAGYSPKNFNKSYDGAVFANNALARSLNIPAVLMLKKFGVNRFYENLKGLNLSTITKSASHYGLSIILGGAETTLWELTGVYASMARVLNHYNSNNGLYNKSGYHFPNYLRENTQKDKNQLQEYDLFGAGPIWLTFEALTEMQRPVDGQDWQVFSSAKKIAWKTGTSFGHRDAWAVGVTPQYVVGVWVGNADGEGRPGLTGASKAAPIMFDIFSELPQTDWFLTPYDDLIQMAVCKKSGYKALNICTKIDTVLVAQNGERTQKCPFHKLIYLNNEKKYQVNSNCYEVNKMVKESRFILPPVMEWYYKNKNPDYKPLPPFYPNCQGSETLNMDLIYPLDNARFFIPKGLNRQQQKVVFEAVHRKHNAIIYWHLDDVFLKTTQNNHKVEIITGCGSHTVTIVDDNGELLVRNFEVLAR